MINWYEVPALRRRADRYSVERDRFNSDKHRDADGQLIEMPALGLMIDTLNVTSKVPFNDMPLEHQDKILRQLVLAAYTEMNMCLDKTSNSTKIFA
jgi:hypothetical protein